jgi:uncharacterized protein YjiK
MISNHLFNVVAYLHHLVGQIMTRRDKPRFAKAALLTLVLFGCNADPVANSAPQAKSDDSFQQWKLPGKLREISGLALTGDERLFGVTDESAIVYEIDYEDGHLVKAFAFGDPVMRGDFEGIAVLDGRVWLMTSDGQLFSAIEGADGEHVQFQKFDTGLGRYCELEGLGQDRATNALFLACKETAAKSDELKTFVFSVTDDDVSPLNDIIVPEKAIAGLIDSKHVNPSGIAIEPESGRHIMVAARQRSIFQLSGDGKLLDAIILPKKKNHRQAEGIEITIHGRLLIADEGGDGKARLAVYRISPFETTKTE